MAENKLQQLKDAVGNKLYGMTITEARERAICIDCKQQIVITSSESTNVQGGIYSKAGFKQYRLSAQCEYCYDKLFSDLPK